MGTRHDLGTSRQLLFLVPAAMLRWAGCARAVLCRGAGAGVWRTESLPLLRPGLAAGLAPRVAAGYHSSPVARADILGSVLDEVTKGDEAKTKGEVEDPLEHISGGTAHKVRKSHPPPDIGLAEANPAQRSRTSHWPSEKTKREVP